MHQLDVDALLRTHTEAGPAAGAGPSRRLVIYRGLYWRLAIDGTVRVREAGAPEREVAFADAPLPVRRTFGAAGSDDRWHAEPGRATQPSPRVRR